MIAINLTFFVILGMFLLFLFVTQQIILKPTLDVMDRRDDRVAADEDAAQQHSAEADTLESRYAEEIARVRRAACMDIDEARREGMLARVNAIRERKAAADQEVAAIKDAASDALDAERKHFDELVPGLADRMAQQLHLGGKS